MRFTVVNLGCKVNRVESDAAAAQLMAAGHEPCEAGAGLVVVNTCTVTGEADKKTRKAVRRALRENPGAQVVVTGCAAAIDPGAYAAMGAQVEVVPKASLTARLSQLAAAHDAADGSAGSCEGACAPCRTGHADGFGWNGAQAGAQLAVPGGDGGLPLRLGGAFRTRVGVKVQDGCDHACTYCIVHVARGRAASRPTDEVVREVSAYARAGACEIVLAGINLGSYRSGGAGLAHLLERLLEETGGAAAKPGPGSPRLRISSIEPMDVDEALIGLLASSNGRICRHLHLPLQSGSSKVLREMARPYSVQEFCDLAGRLYAAIPALSLSTDVIVGFPGESDGEFQETLEVARRCRFSKVHAFPYSRREGTPAAARADQVSPQAKAVRAALLRKTADGLRLADYARRAGTEELVLVEPGGIAVTESYHEVSAPAGTAPGDLVACVLPPAPAPDGEGDCRG